MNMTLFMQGSKCVVCVVADTSCMWPLLDLGLKIKDTCICESVVIDADAVFKVSTWNVQILLEMVWLLNVAEEHPVW